MTPDLITQLLNQILACACECLNARGSCPCPCRNFISYGPAVQDLEACCTDGQLAVWLERIFVHDNFPNEQGAVNVCLAPLAVDVVVSLDRCWPAVVRDDGSAPTADEIGAASEKIYQDLYVLTRCIICNLASRGRQQKAVFRGSTVREPNGGCVRIEIRFTIELPDPLPFP